VDRAAILIALACALSASAKKNETRALAMRAIDLRRRVAVVEVSGFSRSPAANLFTFTDERGRRFVATTAMCENPVPTGERICVLDLPEGYERHKLTALTLHVGNLHSREIAVPPEEIKKAWQQAEAATEPLGPPPVDGGAL
jgi:hypothetical protein